MYEDLEIMGNQRYLEKPRYFCIIFAHFCKSNFNGKQKNFEGQIYCKLEYKRLKTHLKDTEDCFFGTRKVFKL